ncbi:hypothetical protein KC721_01400 [Candidatus Woesebacteria bacterium]|nr:hypothetical protein [Candidatus Woesebacteria bacterium]
MNALYYRRKESYIFKLTLFFYKCLLLLISSSIVLLLARPVRAQEVVFMDTFDEDLSQWEPIRDDGQYWSIIEGKLHGIIPKGFTISELVPNDAVWNPEWHNIIYELDFTPLEGIDKNISFHFENLQNWYEIHFTKGGMEILRLQEYSVPWRAFSSARLNNGETYHLKLVLNEGHFQISINDELVFDQVDPTFTNNYGKIGLKAGTGSIAPTHIAIDNVKISLLPANDAHRLGITRVSQTDERWSQLEYDTASEWNPEDVSIGRWGCALSSMVMILDHYGITTFSDTTPINPETLNAWLNTQTDGYIGEGLLNWLAITRLTSQLTNIFSTPSLELSVVTEELSTTLQNELEINLHPAIVNIPGHFLVADGVVPDSDPTDFYIQDPAYAYTTLSEHTDAPRSLRLFTPSFTDLSYFLFVDESTSTDLTVTKDTTDLPLISTSESLHTETHLLYIPKPEDGSYSISVSGTNGTNYEYTLLIYSQNGEVFRQTLSGTLGPHPDTYIFSFTKESGTSEIASTYTIHSLRNDLSAFYQNRDISSHFVWYELDRLAFLLSEYADDASEIKSAIAQFLTSFSQHISPQTDAYLRAKIDRL